MKEDLADSLWVSLLHCERLKQTWNVCVNVKEVSLNKWIQTHRHTWPHRGLTYECQGMMWGKHSLTSIFLEAGDGRNEDLMEEERTAVHFDGPWEQPSKVIDIPAERDINVNNEKTSMWIAIVNKESTKIKNQELFTCSERVGERTTLYLHKTSSLPMCWGPDLPCVHKCSRRH